MPLLHFLRRFRRDRSGLSAIEFALIAPVMITSLVGAVEVSNGMLADRKVTQTVATVADIVSQNTTITNAQLDETFDAAGAIMAPLDASDMGVRVTSLVAEADGTGRVEWSRGRNMSARGTNSTIEIPAGTLRTGETMIMAEVSFAYQSEFGDLLTSGVTITDKFYVRPRRSTRVQKI